jgi:hypothetical protein
MWGLRLDLLDEATNYDPTEFIAETGVRVLDIGSAQDWHDAVVRFPREHGGRLYLDWPLVSEQFEAVHLTLAAVAAFQGIELATSVHSIGPTYWDTETTV